MKYILIIGFLIAQQTAVYAEKNQKVETKMIEYETDEYRITKKKSKKLLSIDKDTFIKPTYGKDNLRDDEGFQLKIEVVHKF